MRAVRTRNNNDKQANKKPYHPHQNRTQCRRKKVIPMMMTIMTASVATVVIAVCLLRQEWVEVAAGARHNNSKHTIHNRRKHSNNFGLGEKLNLLTGLQHLL